MITPPSARSRTIALDNNGKTVIDSLKVLDWAKVVNYGSVKVQIREGQATKVTIEETIILED